MTGKVIANLASQYENVSREVGGVMVGKTLDYEAKRILTEGFRQGMEQGIEQGIMRGEIRGRIKSFREDLQYSDEEIIARISDLYSLSRDAAEEYLKETVLPIQSNTP